MADNEDFIGDSALFARAGALSADMPAVPTHVPVDDEELKHLKSKAGKAGKAKQVEKKQSNSLDEKAQEMTTLYTSWHNEKDPINKAIKYGALLQIQKDCRAAQEMLDEFKEKARATSAHLKAAQLSREARSRKFSKAFEQTEEELEKTQDEDRRALFNAMNTLVRPSLIALCHLLINNCCNTATRAQNATVYEPAPDEPVDAHADATAEEKHRVDVEKFKWQT